MFYQKYRPENFKQIVGNSDTVNSIKALLEAGNPPHAFLITGGTGCGKTTLSRILRKALGCSDHDYKEINTADFRGIDSVRDIIKSAQFKPMAGKTKVYLIDECHQLTGSASEAILKLLEDPPKHAYFILATTDPQKLIATIKGRCCIYEMQKPSDEELLMLLIKICKKEGLSVSKDALEMIIEKSNGHPRDAINMLEQIGHVSADEQKIQLKKFGETKAETIELCRALINPKSGWGTVSKILQSLRKNKEDSESLRRAILGYCTSVLLSKNNPYVAGVMECFLENTYDSGFSGIVYQCYLALQTEA